MTVSLKRAANRLQILRFKVNAWRRAATPDDASTCTRRAHGTDTARWVLEQQGQVSA